MRAPFEDTDTVISAASCTTNAICARAERPLDDEYGIVAGHVETVHAYTNDQNLIDNYHKAERRGAQRTSEHGAD